MTNFNRRDFLKSMSAAAVTMPFAGAWAQDANAQDRPNILFLFTDQQFAGAMSCVGNEYVKTPNMDRIAKAGTVFTESYCSYPVCTCARASFLTGLMPHNLGINRNNQGIPEAYHKQELGWLLREAGYETAYAGKGHVSSYMSLEEHHGFEILCGAGNMVGHRPGADSGVADACVEYLKREHKTPFMLVGSFLEPHGCCEEAREILKYQGKLPGGITRDALPPLPDNFAIDPNEPEELQKHRALSPNKVHPVDETWNEDMWRYYLYRYYRFVETVDKEVGRVLDALEAQGLADNTVIIFSSDHGDGMGSHQWNQKWVLYEESARIPFIISAPGNRQNATLDSKHLVAACLDLLPTVCDYAGARIPEHCQGKSLRPVLESPEPPNHHEAVFCEVQMKKWMKGMPSLVLRGRMVRTDRYKYIVYAEGARREQLFDLKEDRGETRNLAGEEKFKDVLEQHRTRIVDWCQKTEDKEFLPFLPV